MIQKYEQFMRINKGSFKKRDLLPISILQRLLWYPQTYIVIKLKSYAEISL